MSHFYGTLQGARGKATCCGHKSSGIVTHAAGWQGAIRVEVYHREDGKDVFSVSLVPWNGSDGKTQHIALGVLDASVDFKDELNANSVRQTVGERLATAVEGIAELSVQRDMLVEALTEARAWIDSALGDAPDDFDNDALESARTRIDTAIAKARS